MAGGSSISEGGDPSQVGQLTASHRELLDQVLDKWSLAILENLCERPMRFNELRREIPSVTQKSLSASLRKLERNGVVERNVLSSRPVAVEYAITPLGKTLREPVDMLIAWADDNLDRVCAARRAYDDGIAESVDS